MTQFCTMILTTVQSKLFVECKVVISTSSTSSQVSLSARAKTCMQMKFGIAVLAHMRRDLETSSGRPLMMLLLRNGIQELVLIAPYTLIRDITKLESHS